MPHRFATLAVALIATFAAAWLGTIYAGADKEGRAPPFHVLAAATPAAPGKREAGVSRVR